MRYVDGFLLAVPKKKLQTYRRMAQKSAKIMKDPRLKDMCDPKDMPFDVKRICYGGFKVLVDA